jgi:hypothetical protein
MADNDNRDADRAFHERVIIESFKSTQAFGRLAIVLLFALNAIVYYGTYDPHAVYGMAAAVVCCVLAWFSQGCDVQGLDERANWLRRCSIFAGMFAGFTAILVV